MDRAFIIYELAKSAQVAGHLLRNMNDEQMAEFICKAPITVWWKCDLLREFGFPHYAQIGEAALLFLREGGCQRFVLRSFLSGWEYEKREFTSYEEVERQLTKDTFYEWHILEAWENEEKTWSFYFDCQHMLYFNHWDAIAKADTDTLLFASNNMRTVNLPVPFQIGDLLEIDGTPFSPVENAVVLSEDMQILFPDPEGNLCVDTLESGHVFGAWNHNVVPPLYGTDVIRYANADILVELRNYIGGKAENAEKVLRCFRKYSKGSNRLEQGYFLWRMEQNGEIVSDYL